MTERRNASRQEFYIRATEILRKEQKFAKTSEPIWNFSNTIVGLDDFLTRT